MEPAERHGLREARAVVSGPALDLDQFGDVAPGATREEVGHGSPLRLQPQPGAALPLGRDPQVGDEGGSHADFTGCHV
jgi:hypothetical protein